MNKRLKLLEKKELPNIRHGHNYLYKFSLVDISLIGTPEEMDRTSEHKIKVDISDFVEAIWKSRQNDIDFFKICFEFGKRELIQKIKDGSIQKYQELEITIRIIPMNALFNLSELNLKSALLLILKFQKELWKIFPF